MRRNNLDEKYGLDEWKEYAELNFKHFFGPDHSEYESEMILDEVMIDKRREISMVLEEVLIFTQDSALSVAVVYNELDLFLINYKKNLSERLQFIKLDQKMFSYNKAIILPHNSFIFSTFKHKINQLLEGGFFEHWLKPYLKHRSIVEEKIIDDRVVLTMDHLSVGFTLWLAILLIAAVLFIVEFFLLLLPNICACAYL